MGGSALNPTSATQRWVNVPTEIVIGESHNDLEVRRATFVLVEFGDFECGPCVEASTKVSSLMRKYRSKLAFVYRNLPLTKVHKFAYEKAIVAEAGREQGRFEQIYSRLLQDNVQWNATVVHSIVDDLKLDRDRFWHSMKSTAKARVDRDIKDAERLGVPGTPFFYLCEKGKRVEVLHSLESIVDRLSREGDR